MTPSTAPSSSNASGPLAAAHASPFDRARARFSGAREQVYLDVASRSLVPDSALEIARRHLAERVHGRVDKKRYFGLVEESRERFARLIGARPSDIAITKNVSEGLNIMAAAIRWRPGDEVLLCSAVEHPNNVYAWRNLERQGVRIVDLPAERGEFPVDLAVARLGGAKPPRVLTVSATSFRPGFRTDLAALAQACERCGTLLIVDGAQSVGVNHLDVSTTRISALAVSTQKGLCALYGMGFLYVREALAESLEPRHLARFGVEIRATHEADYDPGPVVLRRGALRFDLGNYNFLAAHLVNDSLQLIEDVGVEAIDAHVTALADLLAHGLAAAGACVPTPARGPRAHIVCIDMGDDPARAADLQRALAADGVQAAVRGCMVRFSIHFYNNDEDILRATASVSRWFQAASQVQAHASCPPST
ncbi:MAG TPA: aminotransferase class V-fold PLP-dependent enzyme [Ramlibacter sp.]|nr:aminotransferase class V-fold PLP-dependent enzyme [Ramlibacter sp.]